MIFDKQNLFADKFALPVGIAAAVVVGDVIDLWAGATSSPNSALPQGVNGPIGGPGAALVGRLNEVYVYVQVTTALNGAGTGTFQLKLVAADDAALTTNPVVLDETAIITIVDATVLPVGAVLRLTGNIGALGSKRYLGLAETVVTAVLGAGAITAGIVQDYQTVH